MKRKVRISENELVKLIDKILSEDPQRRSFGMDLRGKTPEQQSKERKLDYFTQIFLPRFQEIKEVHGLDFTIELLNSLSFLVDEVED